MPPVSVTMHPVNVGPLGATVVAVVFDVVLLFLLLLPHAAAINDSSAAAATAAFLDIEADTSYLPSLRRAPMAQRNHEAVQSAAG
jgi:hypothetical protein